MTRIRDGIFRAFLLKHPNRLRPEDLNYYEDSPEELALINYTSGTSGFSKGVMLPYRSLYANMYAARHVAQPQLDNTSNIVAMLPSAHMYGLMFELLYEMTIGAHTHFLTRIPSPKIILQAFQEIHPSVIISVPLIIEKVYKMKLKPVLDRTKTFRLIPILGQAIKLKIRSELIKAFGGEFNEVILGGAPFNPEVEKFFRHIRFPYTVGYGMTECGPLLGYEDWRHFAKASCGKPVHRIELRIDSANPYKEAGEIQVKGDNVMLGYYKNDEATEAAFTQDGWMRTGDLGLLDKRGNIYIKGRSKSMILGSSGQNIYPEEIEDKLNNLPLVVESVVVERDEKLVALVYPDFDAAGGESKEEAINEIMEQNRLSLNKLLPAFARIMKIELVKKEFEKTPKRSIKRFLYK
jgi:long-chain acyl-CoA synthetase